MGSFSLVPGVQQALGSNRHEEFVASHPPAQPLRPPSLSPGHLCS